MGYYRFCFYFDDARHADVTKADVIDICNAQGFPFRDCELCGPDYLHVETPCKETAMLIKLFVPDNYVYDAVTHSGTCG